MSGELRMLTRVACVCHEEGLPQREIAARRSLPAIRVAVPGGWINVLINDRASAPRLAEETY